LIGIHASLAISAAGMLLVALGLLTTARNIASAR
jgi:hypothetical protein